MQTRWGNFIRSNDTEKCMDVYAAVIFSGTHCLFKHGYNTFHMPFNRHCCRRHIVFAPQIQVREFPINNLPKYGVYGDIPLW